MRLNRRRGQSWFLTIVGRKSVISEEEDGSSKKVPWVGCSAGEFSMCRVTDDPPVVVHHSSSSALSTEVPFSTEASSSTKTLSSADISSSTGILFSTQAPFSTEVLSSTEPPSTEFVFAAETDLSTEAPSSTQAPFLNKTISEVASALETHTRQCNISSVDGVF